MRRVSQTCLHSASLAQISLKRGRWGWERRRGSPISSSSLDVAQLPRFSSGVQPGPAMQALSQMYIAFSYMLSRRLADPYPQMHCIATCTNWDRLAPRKISHSSIAQPRCQNVDCRVRYDIPEPKTSCLLGLAFTSGNVLLANPSCTMRSLIALV